MEIDDGLALTMVPIFDRSFGWVLDIGQIDYGRALKWQRGLVKMRHDGMARDTIMIVEHPPVITVGKDGHPENYTNDNVEAIQIERGGDVTYHGPGQLVVYFIFNLARRGKDLHLYMTQLQNGIIRALSQIGIDAKRGDEYTGVWVGKKKIASIGIAVKQWVSYHGVAINLNTDLDQFKCINPCGLDASVMTSVQEIKGEKTDSSVFAENLVKAYSDIFETTFDPVDLESLAEDIESQAGGYTI